MLIWDAFKGQTTDTVNSTLDIVCVPVPANMTHFFQPLDLTVNGSLSKKLFVTLFRYSIKAARVWEENGRH